MVKAVSDSLKQKSVPKVSQSITYGKSDYRYWKAKVFKNSFMVNGEKYQQDEYSVKFQFKGRRERFNLYNANKELAAKKACEIFSLLIQHGWDSVIEKYKSSSNGKIESPTVGEFLTEVQKHSEVRRSTMVSYETKFRRLVAEVMKIKSDKSKFEASSGSISYRARVNEVLLSDLTPSKINAWKRNHVSKAKDEEEKRSRKITVNSIIRNSKSLFSSKILVFVATSFRGEKTISSREGEKTLKGNLVIPHNPFEDVGLEKVGKKRYSAKLAGLDIKMIFNSAKSELSEEFPEQYKIFILALTAGLRRREIDWLKWKHVDFKTRVVSIMASEHYQLKSSDSEGGIPIDKTTAKLLKEYKKNSTGEFVIESNRSNKLPKEPSDYRCSMHYRKLCAWLRGKGVVSKKPMHTLRQEAISIIAKEKGIHVASSFARHSDIRITSDVYAEQRIRSEVDTASLFYAS